MNAFRILLSYTILLIRYLLKALVLLGREVFVFGFDLRHLVTEWVFIVMQLLRNENKYITKRIFFSTMRQI